MRRVGSLAILGLVACGGGEPAGTPDAEPVADASVDVAPSCGEDETAPAGVTVKGATITVVCDATTLAITTFDDGVARLRYGDAPAPLVALTPPATRAPRVGRRGDALVVCGQGLELTVAARTCALAARDGEGRVLFEDAAWSTKDGDATLARKLEKDERVYGLGLHTAKGIELGGSPTTPSARSSRSARRRSPTGCARRRARSINTCSRVRLSRTCCVATRMAHRREGRRVRRAEQPTRDGRRRRARARRRGVGGPLSVVGSGVTNVRPFCGLDGSYEAEHEDRYRGRRRGRRHGRSAPPSPEREG